MRRKMVFSIWETRKKIRNSSRSFSNVARRAEDEPWNKRKKCKKFCSFCTVVQFWVFSAHCDVRMFWQDKVNKKNVLFLQEMFLPLLPVSFFFCIYTEKNRRNMTRWKIFHSSTSKKRKRQIGCTASWGENTQKKFVKTFSFTLVLLRWKREKNFNSSFNTVDFIFNARALNRQTTVI